MKHIVVDIETNGSNPLMYSMVSIGAVLVEDGVLDTEQTFYAEMQPIYDLYEEGAYKANRFTHEQAMGFEEPMHVMTAFLEWLQSVQTKGERLHFVSDNAGFDWMFVCSYLWKYTGENPFGFSPMSLTWYYKGRKGTRSKFQDFRRKVASRPHTHNALVDALGNAEALVKLLQTDPSQPIPSNAGHKAYLENRYPNGKDRYAS